MVNMIPVDSSNLSSVGYDDYNHNLYIQFRQGEYVYYNVPRNVFQELMAAPSKGKYHAAHIKYSYRYDRIG